MGNLVWLIVGSVVFFALLIVGLAWMYGAQSAKRRRAVEGSGRTSKGSVR